MIINNMWVVILKFKYKIVIIGDAKNSLKFCRRYRIFHAIILNIHTTDNII